VAREPSTFTSSAQALIKAVGAFAAGAYVAERAHLNQLGVPTGDPIGAKRYTETLWQILIVTADRALYLLIAALILMMVAAAIHHFIRRFIRPSWRERISHGLEGDWVPPAFLLLLSLTTLLFIPTVKRIGFLVGPLRSCDFTRESDSAFDFNLVLWTVSVLAFSRLRHHWRHARESADLLAAKVRFEEAPGMALAWKACRVLLAAQVIGLFITFGVALMPMRYSRVHVKLEEEAVDGVLLLDGGEGVTLWTTVSGDPPVGKMTFVPKEKVASIEFLQELDVIEEAKRLANCTAK
jgi:hypothetical protein